MSKINILITDDHEVIHSGITDILKKDKRFQIIGHAYNGEDAIVKARELKPDLIFMDISMPKMNGIKATKIISEELPNIRIIGLTQHEDKEYVVQMLRSGALGYLLKNSRQEEFISAIDHVLAGKKYLNNELSLSLMEEVMPSDHELSSQDKVHLTRREIEIIQKIAEDLNNQEIADNLHISLRTVETHRRNIAQKLNAKSVVSILKYAAQHKLIDL